MKPYRVVIAWVILSLMSFIPGDPLAVRILTALTTHFRKFPQEKVYIQTDKSVYNAGETVWYKIYTSVYGTRNSLSRVIYLQFVDTRGKIIIQNKLSLVDGVAHGDIQLPDSLTSNTYELRCFTKWMLNFDDSSIFHKELFVKNYYDTISNHEYLKASKRKYDIQFLPEGGDLIEGITGNVAFKATDQDGSPVQIQGEIKDENENQVAVYHAIHDGMGRFSLRPLSPHQYSAIVHLPDQSILQVPLKPAKKFGISMKILEQTEEGVAIQLVYHEEESGQYHDVVLAASQNSGNVATYPLELDHGINIFNVTYKGFKTGIIRFTLFNKDGLPEAERILFVDKKDQLVLQLKKDSGSFGKREKSSFTIQVKGSDLMINKANISVSVTDADRVMGDSLSDNINSSLLLSSELKGYVHNPRFYFTSQEDSLKQDLDLVMMTNGWRHFEWDKILKDEKVQISYPVEKALYIGGRIMGYRIGEEKDHFLKMIILQADSTRFLGYVSPDTAGDFVLKDYMCPGLSTVYFKEENHKGKPRNYKINYFEDSQDSVKFAPFISMLPKESINQRNEFMDGIWNAEKDQYSFANKKELLKAVLVKGYVPTKTDLLVRNYVSPLFESGSAHSLDLVNSKIPVGLGLYDYIKGKFPGLIIEGNENNPEFYSRSTTAQEFIHVKQTADGDPGTATSYPYIYLNEVHSSYQAIKDIPLTDIALIRYIPPPAPMAPFNGGSLGVLVVYLRKWDEGITAENIKGDYNHFIFHGFSVARQFYSPDYSLPALDPSKPDTRSTLYWNPEMIADSVNTVHFNFHNSDRTKRFRVVVEGMDQQGRIGYLNQIFAGN